MIPPGTASRKLHCPEGEPRLGSTVGRVKLSRARCATNKLDERGEIMLWTIMAVLLVLWLLGVIGSYTLGGFIHVLLVLALVALVIQLFTGRTTV